MKKILVVMLLLVFCSVPAWGMTLEQMKALAGGDMVNEKMSAVVANYGVPAVIVDHGVGLGMSKQKVKILDKRIALTAESWNFVYASKQNYLYTSSVEEKDPRHWINPRPIMPGTLKGIEGVVFFSFGGKSNLDAHQIYAVYGDLTRDIPADLIYQKFGEPEEFTQDDDFNDIARYWVVLYGSNDFPYKLFLVDFFMYEDSDGKYFTAYKIWADSTDFVADKLVALQEAWQNGSLQNEDEYNDNPESDFVDEGETI